MRLLVWQWGRRGAGPKLGLEMARALRGVPGVEAVLSLSRQAEIMTPGQPDCGQPDCGQPDCGKPGCDLPVDTYSSLAGWAWRLATMPASIPPLARRLRALRLDGALCAMPAPGDLPMAGALRRAAVPFAVVVHDADRHPGDILRAQVVLQRRLLRQADALVALSSHVAARLEGRGIPLLRSTLPPFAFGPPPPPPRAHGGKLRLLSFGRLLPYKGLDLLASALALLNPADIEVRVVGTGPESAALEAMRRLPGVSVENRWVPEAEIGTLLSWADAMVLSHTEASQSGIAAAALTACRWIVATRVGGLPEQLADNPAARLCDPTVPALAQAIVSLLTDPPRDAAPPQAFDAASLAHHLQTVFAGRASARNPRPPAITQAPTTPSPSSSAHSNSDAPAAPKGPSPHAS